MTELRYILTDELGLHARPAGHLVKEASAYESDIKVGTDAKLVDAKRIMGVMGLALKQGDEMLLTFDGPDEEKALTGMEKFLKSNL